MYAVWPRQNGKSAFREEVLRRDANLPIPNPGSSSFVFEGHTIESIDLEQAGDAHGRLTVQLKPGY